LVLPPTPPPDIDLDMWRSSITAIAGWHADTLFITHFGPYAPVAPHLTELADHLDVVARLAKASLERDESDEQRAKWFRDQIRTRVRRRSEERDAQAYEIAGRFDLNWRGLARYWRKRG